MQKYLSKPPACYECGCTDINIVNNHIICPTCGLNDYFKSVFCDRGIQDNSEEQKKLLQELTEKAKIYESKQKFLNTIEKSEQQTIIKNLSEIKDNILNILLSQLILLKAPTGIGKTYWMLKLAQLLAQQNKFVTLVFNTINEIQRALGILKSLGVEENNITLAISRISNPEEISKADYNLKNITLTTYSYLNNRGNSEETHSIAKKLLQKRIVFCDEIHVVEELSDVAISLGKRYLRNGNILNSTDKCPKKIKKGNCADCHYLRKDYINLYNEIRYINELPFVDYKEAIENNNPSVITTPQFYNNGKLRSVVSNKYSNPSKLKPYLKDFEFVRENINNLEDIELRCQFPYVKDKDGNITYLSKNDVINIKETNDTVIYPAYACGVPFIKAKSTTILDNLLSYADSVVMATATLPITLERKIKQKAAQYEFNVEEIEIDFTPYKFNVNIFKPFRGNNAKA